MSKKNVPSPDPRSVSRDERKEQRKKGERKKGQQRDFDRKTKEKSLALDEDHDAVDMPMKKLEDEFPVKLFKRLAIENDVSLRTTRSQRLLAFAMVRHRRLGADSPAFGISRDVCTVIASFVPTTRLILAGGKDVVSTNDDFVDPEFRFRFDTTNRVTVCDVKGKFSSLLEPLPVPLAFAQLLRYKNEIWCVGGVNRKEEVSTSAFVFCLEARMWREKKNVVPTPRRQNKFVIYKNQLLSFGGLLVGDWTVAEDVVYTIEGGRIWPDGLPVRKEIHRVARCTVLLLGDILVVRSGGGDNVDEQDLDYGSSYFADLRPRNPVWRRFPNWPNTLVSSTPLFWKGEIWMLGGLIETGCPTCSCATHKIFRLNWKTIKWEEQLQVLPQRSMDMTLVVTEEKYHPLPCLLGGYHTIMGDWRHQLQMMVLGSDGKWRNSPQADFPGKKTIGAAILQLE